MRYVAFISCLGCEVIPQVTVFKGCWKNVLISERHLAWPEGNMGTTEFTTQQCTRANTRSLMHVQQAAREKKEWKVIWQGGGRYWR